MDQIEFTMTILLMVALTVQHQLEIITAIGVPPTVLIQLVALTRIVAQNYTVRMV